MKTVCYYYDNIFRQLLKNEDWVRAQQAVVDAENAFSIQWDTYKKVQASDPLG